jgi:hypothetical protein
MKKLIIVVLSCIVAGSSRSQVLFFEDFDGVDGATFGGAGTYTFAPGWRLRNVDNRIPDATVAYVNEAWERREDFKFNINDSCAFSTSYYSPAGTADDFMWTPLIGPLPAFSELSWNAVAYDAAFLDGYEVRIMVAGDGPPTGGTGVVGNQLANSTLLLGVPQENVSWTSHTISLAAYAGQMVYIGFRNTSNDKFILLIDDIKVEVNIAFDAQVLNAFSNSYSMLPHSQAANIPLGASIRNNGRQPLTNVNLMARIYNSGGGLVHTQTGTSIATLTSGTTTVFSIPSWAPPAADNYTIRYFPVTSEVDQLPANDTIYKPLSITDSVYARDDGIITMSTGIGVGNGYMGQAFTTQSAVELGSISVAYNRGYTGRRYGLVVWNTSGGVPNSIIAATDTLFYPDDGFLADTVPIHGGKILLPPGEYVVTAIEFDSTIALCMTNDIFTPGKEWVSWSTQPWANVETFGTQFRKPFYIRMNINEAAVLPVKLLAFTGVYAHEGNKLEWQVTEQQDILRYEVERSTDGRSYSHIGSVVANNQSAFTYRFTDPARIAGSAFYRLRIIEINKNSYSRVIHIRPGASNGNVMLFPNPVRSMATLQGNDTRLLNTRISLLTISGMEIKQMTVSQLPFAFDMSGMPAGVYLLRLEDNSVMRLIKE